MLEPKDYQDAIDVQDACNLSGVVLAFGRVLSKMMDDPSIRGTRDRNRHPISVLYADKILSLTGDDFSTAYEVCRKFSDR